MNVRNESAAFQGVVDPLPEDSLSEKQAAVLRRIREQFPGASVGRRRDNSRICFYVFDPELGAVFGALD